MDVGWWKPFRVEITKTYGRKRSESMSQEGLHLLTEIIELPWTSKQVVFKRNTLGGPINNTLHNSLKNQHPTTQMNATNGAATTCKRPLTNTHAYAEDEEWQTWGVSGRAPKPAPRHSNRDWTSTAPEQARVCTGSEPAAVVGGGWFVGSTLADREGQKLSHSPKSLGCLYNTAVIHLIKSRKNIRLKSVQRIIV